MDRYDALLASNKLPSIQIETSLKKLEVMKAELSSNGFVCDLCEQAYANGTYLPTSLGLSDEQIKYMGTYVRQQRNSYPQEWLAYYPDQWEDQEDEEDMEMLEDILVAKMLQNYET